MQQKGKFTIVLHTFQKLKIRRSVFGQNLLVNFTCQTCQIRRLEIDACFYNFYKYKKKDDF